MTTIYSNAPHLKSSCLKLQAAGIVYCEHLYRGAPNRVDPFNAYALESEMLSPVMIAVGETELPFH
jgi:hypothetical protein